MEERIQKIISQRAEISRRAAEKLIAEGRVKVDGRVATLGEKADADTVSIVVNGRELQPRTVQYRYIMLNKPVGYVTTMSDEKGRKTVRELVEDVGVRVYPVGRLDINSEGLLIMTNDGDFANGIMHPSFEKKKTYRVFVTGEVYRGMDRFAQPMELDGVPLCLPEVRLIRIEGTYSVLDITIHEGRNRQVRRMCEIAGLKVTRLIRTEEGGLRLGKLKKGAWRNLTDEEIRLLKCI